MTGTFEIAFDFDVVEGGGPEAGDPVALVGVRYTVDGENIVDPDSPAYTKDYIPDLLGKWLDYVRSLRRGDARTFEFTEYSTIQFGLTPTDGRVEVAVTGRHCDDIDRTYVVDLEQLGREVVDATERYRE